MNTDNAAQKAFPNLSQLCRSHRGFLHFLCRPSPDDGSGLAIYFFLPVKIVNRIWLIWLSKA